MKVELQQHPFPSTLVIVTDVASYKKACIKYLERPGCEDDLAVGICSNNLSKNGNIVVGVFNSKLTTLTHEIAHAVFRILEYRGVTVSHDSEEVFCYMQDDFIKRFFEAIGKKETNKWSIF